MVNIKSAFISFWHLFHRGNFFLSLSSAKLLITMGFSLLFFFSKSQMKVSLLYAEGAISYSPSVPLAAPTSQMPS